MEQKEILNYLEEIIVLGSFATEVTNEVKENRFAKGKVCPFCGLEHIIRNGKFDNKQRYISKSCLKTFTDFTLSPRYNVPRLSLESPLKATTRKVQPSLCFAKPIKGGDKGSRSDKDKKR